MNKKTLIPILICVCFSAAAQRQIILKTTPLSLFDFVEFSAIQLGAEVNLWKRCSWYNEVGVKYRPVAYEKKDITLEPSRGFRAKTELRFYMNKNKPLMSGEYFGINVFGNQHVFNRTLVYTNWELSSSALSNKFKTDSFTVQKRNIGFNLIGGYQLLLNKHFVIDFFAGLGVRRRNIDVRNQEFSGTISIKYPDRVLVTKETIRDNTDVEDSVKFFPQITLGFRMCYQF
jgi:hypothetical protein